MHGQQLVRLLLELPPISKQLFEEAVTLISLADIHAGPSDQVCTVDQGHGARVAEVDRKTVRDQSGNRNLRV